MALVTHPKGSAAMRGYLRELAQDMRARVAVPHDATGALGSSISSELTEIGAAGVTGRILALEYWINVGSGTPKGTFVEVDALTQWALAKGIRRTERGARKFAARISYKIEAEGSRDWRRRGKNVFLSAIEEAQGDLSLVLEAFLSDYDDLTSRLFVGGKIAA